MSNNKQSMGDMQFNGTPEEWEALVNKNKMSNNKQSSVEWLISQFKQYDFAHSNLEYYDLKIPMHIFKNITEQAKAMHESEIQEAFDEGNPNGVLLKTGEQYYNETFVK